MEVTRHYGTHHCPVLSCLRVTSMPGRTRSQRRLHRTRRDCGPRAQRRGRRRCGGNGGAGDASDGRTFFLVVVSKGRTTSDDLPCRNSGASSANNFSPGPITPVRKSEQGKSLFIVSFPLCVTLSCLDLIEEVRKAYWKARYLREAHGRRLLV